MRPMYEAHGNGGLPVMREAQVVAELPQESHAQALAEAGKVMEEMLGINMKRAIRTGQPVHLAFGLTRNQAKQHSDARLLLADGGSLSLALTSSFR